MSFGGQASVEWCFGAKLHLMINDCALGVIGPRAHFDGAAKHIHAAGELVAARLGGGKLNRGSNCKFDARRAFQPL